MGVWLFELRHVSGRLCQNNINLNIIQIPLSVSEQSPSSEGESPLLFSI